jgi:uncharacterized protein YndB with AHSA1/START domain
MTAVDTTAPTQSQAISFEFDLRHPPAKIWRALTEPALMAKWLLPIVNFDLAPGAEFTLQAPPQPGWDGAVNCRVIDVVPHETLSYTWKVGDLDTVVTFVLAPSEAGTRLSLVQSGFKESQKKNFGGARYGWRMMGARLVDILAQID